jgi:hypothetical protein
MLKRPTRHHCLCWAALLPALAFASAAPAPAQTTTLSGQVAQVYGKTSKKGVSRVNLVLNTAQGPVRVHLGPDWFLQQGGLYPNTGDNIEVSGVLKARPRGTSLTAWEVRRGGQSLRLRDERGQALWKPKRVY